MRSPAQLSLVVLGVLLLSAGCLAGSPADPSPMYSPSQSPGTHQETPTPDPHEAALNTPDPDKAVHIRNEWNQSVEIQLRVIRTKTNETVHNDTYTLAPDSERVAYNVSTADPEGVESFQIIATARNTTKRVIIKTNECYGDASVEIQEDGTVYVYYAIC